jgi:hypothetical protein
LDRELFGVVREDLLLAGPGRLVDAGDVDCSTLAARAAAAESRWILYER